ADVALARADLAEVELDAPARASYVGEVVLLRVEFAVDEALTQPGWPQLFAQPLDVPVQLDAAWLDAPPFGRALAEAVLESTNSASFATAHGLSRALRLGEETRGARRFQRFAYSRSVVAERAGRFELEAPRLRFATAARVERDVFDSDVAVDTRFVGVDGSPRQFEVRALPEAGRPAGFDGAIGRFELRAEFAPRELRVGEPLALTLFVSGTGDLASLAAPRIADSSAWHLLGVLEETTGTTRAYRYELRALTAGESPGPRVEFAYFDPDVASYRTLASPSFTVRVAERATSESGTVGEPVPERRALWLVGLAVVSVALVIVIVIVRRGGARGRRGERAAREHAALATLERGLARPAADVEAEWTAFLAAVLGVASNAVSSHDLADRLARAGAPPELAERAARTLGDFVGARFGGAAPRTTHQELVALASELQSELSRPPPG
ncbi:MAG: BatD family protein, partial [Planctomycetes bacterium]|nr:BatD family protein [Planctomycetota bacterium]